MLVIYLLPQVAPPVNLFAENTIYLFDILSRIFVQLIQGLLALLLDKLCCLFLCQVLLIVARRFVGRLFGGSRITKNLIEVKRLTYASCCGICCISYVTFLFTMLISITSWFTLLQLFLFLLRRRQFM